ncbi:hypothetical protein [Streptomyces sp. NPDC005476]|uniref:hypothetical protein n=1 Tax=Streptomyces sp. NPDC005476 TaxID=3156882 RepID=UPI0034551062
MTSAAHQSPYTPELRAAARHLGRRRPVRDPAGRPLTTAASFVTEVGDQGLKPA